MKTKIYTLTTEDDQGTRTSCYTSEQARDDAAWAWLAEREENTISGAALRERHDGDLPEAYEAFQAAFVTDYLSWDDHEIEIPDPAPLPPNAELISIADALAEGQRADIWYDAASYGEDDTATQIEETQNAMEQASIVLRTMAGKSTPALLAALHGLLNEPSLNLCPDDGTELAPWLRAAYDAAAIAQAEAAPSLAETVEKPMVTAKTNPCCSHCGSTEVKVDAWAEWDGEKQDWTLAQTFDESHCEQCEGSTSLDWKDDDAQDGDDEADLDKAEQKADSQ